MLDYDVLASACDLARDAAELERDMPGPIMPVAALRHAHGLPVRVSYGRRGEQFFMVDHVNNRGFEGVTMAYVIEKVVEWRRLGGAIELFE